MVALVEEAFKKPATRKPREDVPPAAGRGKSQPSPNPEVQKLQQQVASLRSELASSKAAAEGDHKDKGGGTAMSEQDSATVKAVQRQIQQLKDLDPTLREALCEAKGGYDAFIADLEKQRQDVFARHRGALPLDVRKSKSEAHVRNMQRNKDAADAKLLELQQQKTDLDQKLAAQAAIITEADAKLQAAKLEAAAIAQAAAAQVWTLDARVAPAVQSQASFVTATAVKSFFQSLPSEVAGHPEGAETITQVMVLLEKLDSAAKQVAAPSAAEKTAEEQEQGGDMELDEETIEQMAEAAVPQVSGDNEAAVQARATKVQQAKANISKVRVVKKVAAKKN